MWSERVVDNLARGGPPKAVPPYVEKKAVRLGSNLIGEFCIFSIAATFISLEFLRQRRKRRQRMQVGPQPPLEVEDQYADGQAARVWARFIGDATRRTQHYGAFLRRLLAKRGVHSVLDVACGTGVDSELLLEAGFHVTSCDASDQMLKHALRTRWRRRRDPRYDQWEIEEANWLTLCDDLRAAIPGVRRFDAVICLGNSFAHMPSCAGEDPQANQRKALRNFWEMVRPGGVLLVDHRNYDAILATGATPKSCFYYNNSVTDIRTSVVYIDGAPVEVAMDYEVGECDGEITSKKNSSEPRSRFRLTYYPHRLDEFCSLLREAVGVEAAHAVYADFRPSTRHGTKAASDGEDDADDELDENTKNGMLRGMDEEEPAVYVHVLKKPLEI